jgi:PAS domain S-box-containing protein
VAKGSSEAAPGENEARRPGAREYKMGPASESRLRAADVSVLQALAEVTSRDAGRGFFQSVLLRVCRALGADFAFVGELRGGTNEVVRTLAVVDSGSVVDDTEYALAETPCENVVGRTTCTYPRGVAALFPHDPMLLELGIEAYVGCPLIDSRGEVMGLIAALFRKPLEDPAGPESILQICSSRVASELECLRAERAREQLLRHTEDRVRELEGLYAVSRVVAESTTLDELFQLTADVITRAWKPEKEVCSRVTFDGREYVSVGFMPHARRRMSSILIDGEVRGRVEVFSSDDGPDLNEHFRLGQEHELIGSVADSVASAAIRLQAVEALSRSEARLRDILDNSAMVVFLKDLDGRYMLVNRLFEELFPQGEPTVGKTDYDIFPPEVAETLREDDRRALDASGPVDAEETVPTADGDRVYLSVKFPLFDSDGKPYGVCGIATDITERKRAEEERAELAEQSRHAQKMDAMGRIAGGVAHDFNNLLTVINSYAGFAVEDLNEGDPMKADMARILDAGNRAAGLVRQLLAFSWKQVLAPKPLDVNDVVDNRGDMLRRLLGEEIEFSTSLTKESAVIVADAGQIDQVLMNLVLNAKDAMPTGGKLHIRTAIVELDSHRSAEQARLHDGEYVTLTVEDNGVGISPEIRERIFEPFYTSKAEGRGTGLGLATVYGIVEQSGGTVQLESEPGEGSTFTVYLPRAVVGKAGPSSDPEAVSRPGTETILLVEDQPVVRALTTRILESAGYKVIHATDGADALAVCERHEGELHLVLTDVVMPKVNGRELVDRLLERMPAVKVIYMSGYAGDVLAQHGIADEPMNFIAKPFDAPGLLKNVRNVLDKH